MIILKCTASIFAALLIFSGCAPAAPSDAPAAAVLSAQPKTIDGDAADWAGQRASQTIRAAQDEVAGFQLAYDAQFLYAIVRVRDGNPLKNATSPADAPMLLKGGDAIGFTFGAGKDAQRLLIAPLQGGAKAVLMRPQSAVRKPYTYKSPVGETVLDYVAVAPEVKVAFQAAPGGYIAEIAIPWKTLNLAPGAPIPFDVQVIFSDAAGQANASTRWWHSESAGALATVDLPTEARLYPEGWGVLRFYQIDPGNAAATDAATSPADGVPIRFTLPRATKVSLNVTDKDGWILRELIIAQPMEAGAHTVFWDGRDAYGDPMPPGDYRWKLAQFAGVGSKRIGGAGNSARPPFRTPDGKGDLGAVHGRPAALASDAGGVYHLGATEEGNPSLTKLSTDGFALWKKSIGGYGTGLAMFADDKTAYLLARTGDGKVYLSGVNPQTGADAPLGAVGTRILVREGEDGKLYGAVGALVVLGEKAYFSVARENQINVVNLQSGASETAIALPAPRGICRWDETHLLVCTGNKVVKLDVQSGASADVLTGLDEPHAVALDRDRNIYVSQWGKSQQILKFSSGGKLLARLGKAGGRAPTASPYDPDELFEVKGLTVGPQGNLWFLEASDLRRAGVLGANGKWLKDVFQTPPSQMGAGVDFDDARRVFHHTDHGATVMQSRIDYAAAARQPDDPASYWKPETIYEMPSDALVSRSTSGVFYAPIAFTARNGQRYLWNEAQNGVASLWMKDKTGELKPIHAIGFGGGGADAKTLQNKYFTWSDNNGDGREDAAEIEAATQGFNEVRWIDADLALYGTQNNKPVVLRPYKIDERGVPFYRLADLKTVVTQGKGPEYYFRDGSYSINISPPAPDGGQYAVFNIGAPQGRSFWDRATYSRIARIRDGKIQWIAGRHDGRKIHDGEFTYAWRPLGEVDGVVVVGDVDFQLIAYTSDGFCLGALAPVAHRQITPESIVQENVQGGHFFKDPKTGKPVVVIGSGTEVLVLEVTGIGAGTVERQGGEVRLDTARPRFAQTTGALEIPYRTWPATDNGRFQGINGEDYEWSEKIPDLALRDDKGALIGSVRLRRDAGFLNVYASVIDSTPVPDAPENPAADWRKLDGIELLLGPDKAGPDAGGTRIFLTGKRGKDDATGQPTWSGVALMQRLGADAEFQPMPDAKVAVRKSLNGNGYHLEAEIPIALFPQISRERDVTYIRNYQPEATRPGDMNETYTKNLPDLPDAFRFDVALWRDQKRFSWMKLDETNALESARWGVANAPVVVNFTQPTAAQPVVLAGVLRQVEGGVLKLQSGQSATFDWQGEGGLPRRTVGSKGHVLFRWQNGATPKREIRAPFEDTFGDADTFWYGEGGRQLPLRRGWCRRQGRRWSRSFRLGQLQRRNAR